MQQALPCEAGLDRQQAPIARPRGWRLALAVALLAAPAMAATVVQAQGVAPSQVTPPTLRPPSGEPMAPGVRRLPAAESRPAPAATPAGGAELRVTVGRVSVDGAFAEMEETSRPLLAALESRRLTVRELFAAASALERLYSEAGYPLVRVVLPPQKLVDGGGLRMVVVDGFIEEIDVAAVPARIRQATAHRLAILLERRHLNRDTLERAVLLAGDLAGLTLRSALAPGQRPGGVRLVLDGRHRLLSGTVSTDNRQSATANGWGVNASVTFNSLLGRGEQVYLSATTPADVSQVLAADTPMRVTGGGLVLPLGNDGLTLNLEVTRTQTRSAASAFTPATEGTMTRYALRASYPLRWTRAEKLNLTAALDHLDQLTDMVDFGVRMRHDRYTTVRPGLEWRGVLASIHTIAASVTLSQGLDGRDADDARRTGVPLSRLGASPTFSKVAATVQVTRPVTQDVALSVTLKGQSSFGAALFTSEQFSLDGLDAVSPFLPGTFSVDEGATVRAEFVRQMELPTAHGPIHVAPYAFVSAGRGSVRRPTAVESKDVTASGYGVGVRLQSPELRERLSTSAHIEAGRQVSDLPGNEDEWRVNAQFAVRF